MRKRWPGKGLVGRQKEEMVLSLKSHVTPEALAAPAIRNGPRRTSHLSNAPLFPHGFLYVVLKAGKDYTQDNKGYCDISDNNIIKEDGKMT